MQMNASEKMQEEIKANLESAETEIEEITSESAEKLLEGFIRDYHRSTGF